MSPGADALADIANFRDAGGLPIDAGVMREGVLYRSARLSGLDDDGQDALLRIGVTDVFDLRTTEEVDQRPDQLPPAITLTLVNVLADRPHGGAVAVGTIARSSLDAATVGAINDALGVGRARDLMIDTYRDFATLPSALAGFGRVIRGVANAEGASIVHCTAGKDRSGWVLALMQLAVGASSDAVMADYLRSNEAMALAYGSLLEQFGEAGGDAESLARILYVEPDYLDAGFSELRGAFGGLGEYLRGGLKLEDALLDRLRARLLPPSAC